MKTRRKITYKFFIIKINSNLIDFFYIAVVTGLPRKFGISTAAGALLSKLAFFATLFSQHNF